MRFDPVADPWGTAMLAAAGLWLLSMLVVLAAVLGRTSRRTGGYLMLLSLLAFVTAAVGGAWERIRQADELVAVAPPAPVDETVTNATVDSVGAATGGGTRGDPDGAGTGGPAGDDSTDGPASGDPPTGGAEPTGHASGGTGDATAGDATAGDATAGDATAGDATAGDVIMDDETTGGPAPAGSTGEPDPTGGEDTGGDTDDGGLDEPGPDEPVVPEDLPQVDPLPAEPRARDSAIRDILEDAARAAGGGERCGNLERVALAWARLQTIPVTRKAKSVAANLERCRRRLLYSISQKRLAEMTQKRDAWFAKLPGKLRKQQGLIVQASVSGGSHERLRLGNRELDATRADALMDGGLRDDLVRLQFAHVVISNGKKAKTYELEVTPEGELGLPWLRAVGLGEPLRLAK